MINRISELSFWGPEEQIRRFISQSDTNLQKAAENILKIGKLNERDKDRDGKDDTTGADVLLSDITVTNSEINAYGLTQRKLTQLRIENLDEIFQKQLIWSYGKLAVDDAYFYWDWCPQGSGTTENPKWKIVAWDEFPYNLARTIDRSFKFTEFKGVTNTTTRDQMPVEYDSRDDAHTRDETDVDNPTTLDVNTLYHNIMRSYIEVSEWLGDGALQYGSHNGYVSRKMSLSWLFNSIKALINWKLANQEKWAEADINPLDVGYVDGNGNFQQHTDTDQNKIYEGFTDGSKVNMSTQGYPYDDQDSLDQQGGCCAPISKCRAREPWKNGVLKVRGNEFHYGERAYFYTHNSFVGECRFFHNARFLGQTTFDKEINGTAMRSRWADLAEFKEADQEYQPGTLVMFGGEKEITLSRNGVANAIVTTKPGLVLNGENQPGKIMVGIALTGTVPVRVSGKVNKFDRLVADKKYPGMARAKKWYEFWKKPIAVALESWPAGGKVNCITKMEF